MNVIDIYTRCEKLPDICKQGGLTFIPVNSYYGFIPGLRMVQCTGNAAPQRAVSQGRANLSTTVWGAGGDHGVERERLGADTQLVGWI